MQPHPVQLTVDMTCKDAARQLLANDISSAPVVDSSGKLVGILSESDLLWKGAGAPLDHTIIPPVFVGAFDLLISLRDSKQVQEEVDKILARTVGQAMSKRPTYIGPNATLSQAAHAMLAHKIHSLPVLDDDGRVVGVVTQHDILRGMVAEQLPLL